MQTMNMCDSTVADSDSLTGDQLASKRSCSDSSAIPLQPLRSSANFRPIIESHSLRSEQCDRVDAASFVSFSCPREVGLLLTESFSISFSETSEGMVDACILKRDTVVVVRSKAINHLHLAVVLMSTVGLSSLFSFILRTHLAYDVSTNLELAS